MKAFKNKSEDFKLNTSPYRQPVETTEDRSYVFKFPLSPSILILHHHHHYHHRYDFYTQEKREINVRYKYSVL